ncbi:LytTR family DNA-binding domain-containing protein [Salinicoccus bachuensis]|uniref:LytTR family DNA-binding domain-containing protein n=1 Tax=Salinicoccus bachuensis TaxID=3136731 RepID=A0ABZ3CJD1_9STAP
MDEIRVSEVIGKENGQAIAFEPGESVVIQMPVEYINRIADMLKRSQDIFLLESSMPFYNRLTVREQLKFNAKWHGSGLAVENIIRQYNLEPWQKTRLSKCTEEIIQRMGYIHAMMSSQKNILAVDPLHSATVDNIHLFHKAIHQMKRMEKSMVIITQSTEEAFVLSSDILKLNEQGLKSVATDEASEEPQVTLKRLKAKYQDKTIFIDLEDIEYIESSEGKVLINISREKFVMEGTLAQADENLRSYGFYRCHRSYIVNLKKVKEIISWSKNTYSVVMDNPEKTKIPLSRTKYNEIQELLLHH